jgi:2-polyprenyl-3-methyl-5-hydroxy-6-metoxy-1,4-benzoquinol methylase
MNNNAWDIIYRKYQKGGKAWASLSDDIHGSFISFLKKTKFERKSVLDLGCGDGKYLKLLQGLGFSVFGIDSSPAAIKIARKALGKNAELRTENIYHARLPARRYNLVISVAAIQHGAKSSIKQLVDRIYKSLVSEGKIFITFPRSTSLKRWATFGKTKEIDPGTYIPLLGPEQGLPHSFYEKEELKKLFSRFKKVKMMRDDRGRWIVTGQKE